MSDNEAPTTGEGSVPGASDQNPTPATSDSPAAADATTTDASGERPQGEGEDSHKKKRRRRKKTKVKEGGGAPAVRAPGADTKTPAELIELAFAALGSAYVDLKRRAGGSRLDGKDSGDAVEMTIQLPLRRGGIKAAAESLVAKLREDLEKRVMDAGLVVPGRVWNFASESFDSPWSRPEDPRHVLVGYGLEGRPRWADLVTLAIERKHEAVEQLLSGREGAVAFAERGDAITEGVKPAFEPESIPFRLVGQLVCGLFESTEAGRRVALTVQVLAAPSENNGERLLCHPVSAVDLADLPDPNIRKILSNFETQLIECAKKLEGKRAAGETPDVQEEVLPLLRELARRLSQDAKNRTRKTEHARDRGDEGRPTTMAFPEARSARDHHIYMDNEESTIVVVGKKGRIHVFSPDGRHVTSVVMPPPNVRQRVKSGRWRLAGGDERNSFRNALGNA